MRTKNYAALTALAFILLGIVAIVGGIFLTKSMIEFRETAVETKASIQKVEEHIEEDGKIEYEAHFIYIVDGKTYKGTYNSSRFVSVGSSKTVYYDKNNPARVETTITGEDGIILSALGGAFVIIGILGFVSKVNRTKKQKNLLVNGDKIYADFKEVVLTNSRIANKSKAYMIVCTGTDNVTGELRTFTSDNLWYNPELILAQKGIKTFPVYIDKTDRSKYYLSLEEIGLG